MSFSAGSSAQVSSLVRGSTGQRMSDRTEFTTDVGASAGEEGCAWSAFLFATNGCGGGDGGTGPIATNPPPSPGPAPAPPPEDPAPSPPPPLPPPAGERVVMVGNALMQTFDPRDVTVARGTRIVRRWNDTQPHSTTSDVGPGAVWDSGVLTGVGQEFAFTFDDAGTFPYDCVVHGAPGGIGMADGDGDAVMP